MFWDISPLRPSIFQPRTRSTACSSLASTPRETVLSTSWDLCCPEELPAALVWSLFILWISPEPALELTWANLLLRGSSMVFSTAAVKSLSKTVSKVSTRDSQSPYWASSPIALFISGISCKIQWLRLRKKLHLGLRRRTEVSSLLPSLPVRSNRHLFIWDPRLSSWHHQKKIDDGEW